MKLSVVGSKRFSVDLIFSPWRLSGLLLLNLGNEEESYVFIKMKKAVLNFCFNCGKKRVCTDLSNIQVKISCYNVHVPVDWLLLNGEK